MTAHQNVQITSKQQQIYGDEGTYDADKRLAVLTGQNLRFVGPNEVVTASDALEYWQDRKQAVARGHAVAIRDKRRVEADKMIAQFRDAPDAHPPADTGGNMELQQLTAIGNVVITTDTDIARGNKAVYDMSRNVAVLTGDVRVTRGASQMNGSVAEVDFKTGVSQMLAGGRDARVHALFIPGENKGGGTSILPVPIAAKPTAEKPAPLQPSPAKPAAAKSP